jgi:hypothetical protein
MAELATEGTEDTERKWENRIGFLLDPGPVPRYVRQSSWEFAGPRYLAFLVVDGFSAEDACRTGLRR